jgi:hypothetical protein
MALEDADFLAEVSEPDTGGQPGHSGPDDGNVVVAARIHPDESAKEKAGN